MKFGYEPINKKASELAFEPPMKVYNCSGGNSFRPPFNPSFYDNGNAENYANVRGGCQGDCGAVGQCYRQVNALEVNRSEGSVCYREYGDVKRGGGSYSGNAENGTCNSCYRGAYNVTPDNEYYYNENLQQEKRARSNQTINRQMEKTMPYNFANDIQNQRNKYYGYR